MKYIIAILFSIVFVSTPVLAGSSDNNTYTKPPLAIIKAKLTPIQYNVTQEEGTEPAFRNSYWDNHQHGIYVDIVTGEPLFSSYDKYDSGTGWPSFTKTIEKDVVVLRTDTKLLFSRTEVRSKYGNSHLGHLFNDGPAPTGFRYCMNSAALRFVPVSQMKKQGYEKYISLFTTDVKKQKRDSSIAIFAGGCFWSMQRAFDEVQGVISTTVGYAGGRKSNPSYKEVCTGKTGHAEAVQVEYDPDKVTYSKLLEVFWSHVDPTDSIGQFCDKGDQYRSQIFVINDEQKSLANISALEMSKKYKRKLSTKITIASKFYPAETEHQSYYKKHPIEYEIYKTGCGRDRRLEELKKMQK